MSRMTTSLASFSWRAPRCDGPVRVGQCDSSVADGVGAVEAVRGDQLGDAAGTSGVDVLPAVELCAQVARGHGCGSISKNRDAVGLDRAARGRLEPLARLAGRVATREPRGRAPRSGSFQERKSQNSSAPIRNTGSPHSGCARSARPCAHARRGRRRRRERGARELEWHVGRRLDIACDPGPPRRARAARRARAPPSRARATATWPRAAGRTRRRRARVTRARTPRRRSRRDAVARARRLAAHARAPPRDGGVPTTRKPRRCEDAPRARLLRPVDEEVRELLLPVLLGLGLRHEREERAAGTRRSPAPVAHERRTRRRSAVLDRERGLGLEVDLVQHDDLRPLVEPFAVGGELAVDRPPLLVGVGSTRR